MAARPMMLAVAAGKIPKVQPNAAAVPVDQVLERALEDLVHVIN